MPDVLRLRFLGESEALIPALGRTVEPEQLVDVPGRLLSTAEQCEEFGVTLPPDDALLIAVGNPVEVRAFPTSLWRDETPVARTKTTAKE